MKLALLCMLLFVIGNVYAFSMDISFPKDAYSPGETLQADILIDGTLEENIVTQNIGLVCDLDNGEKNLPIIAPSLIRIEENHYYSYFDLNENLNSGNCSVVVKNVIYYENGFLEQEDFSSGDFRLDETNNSLIFVSPAAFVSQDVLDDNSFDVYVTNNNQENLVVNLSSGASYIDLSKDSLQISKDDTESFNVYVSPLLIPGSGKETIVLKYNSQQFSIPIWLFYESQEEVNNTEDNTTIVSGDSLSFVMDVDSIDVSVEPSKSLSGYVTVKNTGTNTLDSVVFELTGNLSNVVDLQTPQTSVAIGETFKEYIYVNQKKNSLPGSYEGNLKVSYNGKSIEYPIYVNVLGEDSINTSQTNITRRLNQTNGEDSSSGVSVWWFVGIFFVIVFIVLYLLYKKKTKRRLTFPVPSSY